MKKLLSITLLSLLSAFLVAGCGARKNNTDTTKDELSVGTSLPSLVQSETTEESQESVANSSQNEETSNGTEKTEIPSDDSSENETSKKEETLSKPSKTENSSKKPATNKTNKTESKVNTNSKGESSETKEYISKREAKAIALKTLGIKDSQINDYEFDSEWQKEELIYEISFEYKDVEYEYYIDALTGRIIRSKDKKNKEESKPSDSSQYKPKTEIGEAQAKNIALEHTGLLNSVINDYEFEVDIENGIKIYEINFSSGALEYSFEIRASDGMILDYEKEKKD